MARSVPGIVFGLASLKLEDIVLEIMDNSLDNGGENIHLQFFECTSSEENSDVGFAVFDDGNGFGSSEKLFNAFEIEEIENQKERKKDDIGKYHIGMKIAPLSMYNYLFVFTMLDGEPYYCSAVNPIGAEIEYNMDLKPYQNPTMPKMYAKSDTSIPDEIHVILEQFVDVNADWTTCVVASHRVKNIIEDGKKPIESFVAAAVGAKHFGQILGMTYQKYLEKAEPPSIKIHNPTSDEFDSVTPIDPFWKAFTPKQFKIEQSKCESALSKATDEEKILIQERISFCKAMAKFGTFEGYQHLSSTLKGLKIRPYVIPSSTPIRTIIKNNLEAGIRWDKENTQCPMDRAITGAPSRSLNSEFVTGFFFYRDNRLINYGSFYELNVPDNVGNSIRIEVEYPSSLDEHLAVSPNKDRVDKFSKTAWKEILLGLKMDGGGADYAAPFNLSKPFFVDTEDAKKTPTKKKRGTPNALAHYPNVLVRDGEKGVKYVECTVCKFAHEPGETCAKWECSTCGLMAKGCTKKKCSYNCATCTKKGECSPSTCNNKCPDCQKIHDEGDCKKKCDRGCGQLIAQCQCICEKCGEKHEKGKCKKICDLCNKEICNCEQGENTLSFKGPKVKMTLWKKNKDNNIEKLKGALERLGLSHNDLI
jgi:hypothetical protein